MRDYPSSTAAMLAMLLLAACSDDAADTPQQSDASTRLELPEATPAPSPAAPPSKTAGWDLQSSGEGTALVFPNSGKTAVRLFCAAGAGRILVNVPAFRPIGSEERLSFGSGGNAHALVADTRGDRLRGGVSGTGAVPGNLAVLIGGPISVSYGSQSSGPHPAVPSGLIRDFALACRESAAKPSPTPTATGAPTSPCRTQDGEALTNPPLRAVGTEPFWGARIDGRCVTYSHPDDQQGTRVWTKYAPRSGGGGSWTGALGGKPFVLVTRPQANCSDGMSDRRYPIAVALTVGGEQRQGCAEPS